jgi:outer membrane cobalamin receptor
LDVNNLLGQDYEVIVNYPMPGRNYALTLSVEI